MNLFGKTILKPFNTKVGLALGGGAARGVAHIGVLKALRDHDVEIEFISGTSVGAIVASYYAFNVKLENLEEITELLRAKSVMNFNIGKMGIVSTEPLRKKLLGDFGDVQIEDSAIPLAICATDINTGESIFLRTGSLVDAICASSAVPGLTQPVSIGNHVLVDGGITNNVPLEILEEMGAGITVGVDLNGVSKYPEVKSMLDVMANSLDIAIDVRTKEHMKHADLPIRLDLSKYSRLDNHHKKEEIMKFGYDETVDKLRNLSRHKRFRIAYFLKTIYEGFSPIKIPEIIQRLRSK